MIRLEQRFFVAQLRWAAGLAGCSTFGEADLGGGDFCRNRAKPIVDGISEPSCNQAGAAVAEWIDGRGCYCF